MKVAFELPLKIQSLNVGNRMNLSGLTAARRQRFAVRRKVKLQRIAAHLQTKSRWHLIQSKVQPTHLIVVTLTRVGPGTLDSEDNLAGAFKAVRDGVAGGLGIDDADPCLRWLYAQRKSAKGVYAARVMIEVMWKPDFITRLAEIEGARP